MLCCKKNSLNELEQRYYDKIDTIIFLTSLTASCEYTAGQKDFEGVKSLASKTYKIAAATISSA
jgi:hypothetical protein